MIMSLGLSVTFLIHIHLRDRVDVSTSMHSQSANDGSFRKTWVGLVEPESEARFGSRASSSSQTFEGIY